MNILLFFVFIVNNLNYIMRKILCFLLVFVCVEHINGQEDIKESIRTESIELKNLEQEIITLQSIRNELGGIFKNPKQKKDIDDKIYSYKEKIIDKKVILYQLRTELQANDPLAISVNINNVVRQNKIKTYTSLIQDANSKKEALIDESGNVSDVTSYKDLEELIKEYEKIKKSIDQEIKLEIIDIFEQAEKIQKEKLPFDLTSEEELNLDKDKLVKQKKDVNDKFKRLMVNEQSKKAFANTKATYLATIYNTNFTVPVARFNFKDGGNSEGNVVLFNSIGAGFGISFGKLEEIRDGSGDIVATDFRNTFSMHGGVLFSASSGNDGNNVFAPVISLGFLDFQLGLGYELGTIAENQDNFFLTIGYAIPLYKLTKTKFYVRKKSKILNEITTF